MFVNTMPRYEILSEDAMATLDRGWRRIVSELGVEFDHDGALDLLREAGQTVEGQNVKFDPDWILEQVAKAPREFDVQARNPANSVHIGGDHMVFSCVYGPPFVPRARRAATRRWTTSATSSSSPSRSRSSTRQAGSSASRTTRRSTRATSTCCSRCRR